MHNLPLVRTYRRSYYSKMKILQHASLILHLLEDTPKAAILPTALLHTICVESPNLTGLLLDRRYSEKWCIAVRIACKGTVKTHFGWKECGYIYWWHHMSNIKLKTPSREKSPDTLGLASNAHTQSAHCLPFSSAQLVTRDSSVWQRRDDHNVPDPECKFLNACKSRVPTLKRKEL